MFKLVNNETGEATEHPSMYEASHFLGRHRSYIGQTVRAGYAIRDPKGYEYTLYKDGEIFNYERAEATKNTHAHRQICFTCAKAVCGCSWSKNFAPIEGWDAVPTKIVNWTDKERTVTTDSYAIRGCPEYEEG